MAPKVFDRTPTPSFNRSPVATGPDCRGADRDGNWAGSNIGSGTPTEVPDRVPRAPLTPDYSSVPRSLKGRGLNKETINESLDDLNQGGGGLEGDVDRTWGE